MYEHIITTVLLKKIQVKLTLEFQLSVWSHFSYRMQLSLIFIANCSCHFCSSNILYEHNVTIILFTQHRLFKPILTMVVNLESLWLQNAVVTSIT